MWPEEGDFPENVHRVVYVIINKRSFETFMCLDLLLFHSLSFVILSFLSLSVVILLVPLF